MRIPLALLALAACSDPDVLEARQIPAALRADVDEVARGNNQFAIDLYRAIAATSPGNVALSPFSVATVLQMLDAGAAGTTDAELRAALHTTLVGERTHAAFGGVLASLEAGRAFDGYSLAIADRLFAQQGQSFRAEFLATTREHYDAELQPLDFRGNLEGARSTINQWVGAQTDGEIPELFQPGVLDDSTVLALVNAIVFKGTWDHPFDAAKTAPAPFFLAGGGTVQASMMHKHVPLAQAELPGGNLAVLPFSGDDLSFVILLPDAADGLPALEAALTADGLAQSIAAATQHIESQEIQIDLPKFSLNQQTKLIDALAALGVHTMFQQGIADLSGIDGSHNLYVSSMVHQATVSVDENGAKAAAATGGGVSDLSLAQFSANRPFLFAIYDHVTGSVLFLGRVVDPTQH